MKFSRGLIAAMLAIPASAATLELLDPHLRVPPAPVVFHGADGTVRFNLGSEVLPDEWLRAATRTEYETIAQISVPDGSSLTGWLRLAIPATDTAGDGWEDLLQPDQSLAPVETTGQWWVDTGSELLAVPVTARWSRPVALQPAELRLTWHAPALGLDAATSTHAVLTTLQRGPLTYESAGTAIATTVELVSLTDGRQLAGDWPLRRLSPDLLQPGSTTWQQAGHPPMAVPGTQPDAVQPPLQRVPGTARYVGMVRVREDETAPPATGPRHRLLEARLTDPADADANGRPDIGDGPGEWDPPILALQLHAAELRLLVDDLPGREITVQFSPTLVPAAWTNWQTVLLAEPPQIITVPAPPEGTGYYRLRR